MTPSAPSVNLLEQYAQSIRVTSLGNNGNDSKRISPINPNYHKTLGDSNLTKAFVRHGPDALYVHIMKAAFDPVYGREMSIAMEEDVKPATRFPLAEESRQHERSENNNSLAKVYNIDEHPRFKVHNQSPGDKKQEDNNPYQPYKSAYGERYGAGNALVIYGSRAKKQDAKSLYLAEREQQQTGKRKEYKGKFVAANNNEKRKSLYERTREFIAKTYGAVSKAISYLTAKGYDEKTSHVYSMPAEYGNADISLYSGNVVGISQYSAQRKGLNDIVNTRLPANIVNVKTPARQTADVSLEERLAA